MDKNLHHGQKVGNKSTQHEGKKNGDDITPYIEPHIGIEHANHKEGGRAHKIHAITLMLPLKSS